jgi:hypothetical protein
LTSAVMATTVDIPTSGPHAQSGEGFSTPHVMAVLRQLMGARISAPTLSRWVDRGLAVPSVAKSRASGVSHLWSATDVIGLAWLLQARGDGLPVSAYGEALEGLWARLPALLRQRGPLFVVVVGRDITVLARAAIARRLSAALHQQLCIWPLPGSLREVERALAELRPGPAVRARRGQRRRRTDTDVEGRHLRDT